MPPSNDEWLDIIDRKTPAHHMTCFQLQQLIAWYEYSHPLSIMNARRLRKMKEALLRKKIRGQGTA